MNQQRTHTLSKRKTTAVTEGSGERRLSLYDVLTGEAPLPPPRGEKPDAGTAAASIMSGGRFHRNRCSGGGGGDESDTVPLGGGARRASIFDRIADVVFNEEQKDQNPVDAVAVRYCRRFESVCSCARALLAGFFLCRRPHPPALWMGLWGQAEGKGGWRISFLNRI